MNLPDGCLRETRQDTQQKFISTDNNGIVQNEGSFYTSNVR